MDNKNKESNQIDGTSECCSHLLSCKSLLKHKYTRNIVPSLYQVKATHTKKYKNFFN